MVVLGMGAAMARQGPPNPPQCWGDFTAVVRAACVADMGAFCGERFVARVPWRRGRFANRPDAGRCDACTHTDPCGVTNHASLMRT
jgi:hypothetical protein